MSVVVYECDTCNREIDIVRNERGLDTVKRCVITNGCKGSLYQIEERSTSVFGRPVEDVEGLDNYRQRNILYIHNQLLSSSQWIIEHDLNTDPAVVVYIDVVNLDGTKSYQTMDPDDYVVSFVDGNNIQLDFAVGTTGIAHVIARSSNTSVIQQVNQEPQWYQVTANSILTIGVPLDIDNPQQFVSVNTSFISPSTSEVVDTDVTFTAHKFNGEISLFNTPWQDGDLIFVGATLYKVMSTRISDVITSQRIENGSPFYFNRDDIVILTSNQPYSSLNVDTNLQRVFRSDTITNSLVNANTRVEDLELTIDETQAIDYHPAVKIIERIF